MVDALQILPGQAQPFRSLCADTYEDGLKTKASQIVHGNVTRRPNFDISIVGNVLIGQRLTELLPKAVLHLIFVGIDSVFRKPTGLDIPVEEDYARTFGSKFPRAK